MSPSALPLISEQDYPVFQQMIGELRQTTYEEWHEDHTKSIAYRRSRNGFAEIGVSPGEFDKWLKDNNKTGHLELLWVFAEDKAERLSRQPEAGGSAG
nr:hypothetical protein [uncultured Rhodopila sp.]